MWGIRVEFGLVIAASLDKCLIHSVKFSKHNYLIIRKSLRQVKIGDHHLK